MSAVIIRIVMRYLSGLLVGYGVIPQEVGAELAMDPDVALVLGGIIGAATEAAYAFARKRGWST